MAKKKAAKKQARPRTDVNADGFFKPFNIDDVPWEKTGGSTTFKCLGAYGGGSQVGVGLDVLKPGVFSNRFHFHLHEEEHVYIIKGSATLMLGNTKYIMNERDYCCFPAGQRAGHHLFNHTKVDCIFMTIGDNRPEDIACFPDAGKARIRSTGEMVPIDEVLAAQED